jgi:hypothetical protein
MPPDDDSIIFIILIVNYLLSFNIVASKLKVRMKQPVQALLLV